MTLGRKVPHTPEFLLKKSGILSISPISFYVLAKLTMLQMAHYAYIYFRNTQDSKEVGGKSSRVEIVIPTGACGNITGISSLHFKLVAIL